MSGREVLSFIESLSLIFSVSSSLTSYYHESSLHHIAGAAEFLMYRNEQIK